MLPWMESLKPCGSTCRLTVLPFSSWASEASLWQARHSSAVGFAGVFWEGLFPAARTVPAVNSRVRATPGAKILHIVRVDILSPANLYRIEFCWAAVRPPLLQLLGQTANVGDQTFDVGVR